MRIGNTHPENTLTEKHQLHQRKGIYARLGQGAVLIKFHAFGHEVGPRKLTEFRGDYLGILLGSHYVYYVLGVVGIQNSADYK